MARKEYSMIEIVDVLRRYQQGDGIRAIARSTGIDRNTVRKYLRMAEEKGFSKDGSIDLESLATEVFSRSPGAEWTSYVSRSRSWPLSTTSH